MIDHLVDMSLQRTRDGLCPFLFLDNCFQFEDVLPAQFLCFNIGKYMCATYVTARRWTPRMPLDASSVHEHEPNDSLKDPRDFQDNHVHACTHTCVRQSSIPVLGSMPQVLLGRHRVQIGGCVHVCVCVCVCKETVNRMWRIGKTMMTAACVRVFIHMYTHVQAFFGGWRRVRSCVYLLPAVVEAVL
jgi:hypothetical protein